MNPCFALLFLLPLCLGNVVVDNAKVVPGTGADQVLNLVLATIDQATKGLATSKLLEAAQQVKSLADSLTGEVSKEAVNNLIKEISAKIGAVSAISEMLEDKLSYDARLLNDFLEIWSSLALSGKELKASEQSVDVIIASISKISTAIQSVVGDIVDVVVYSQDNNSTGSEIKPKDVVIQYDQNTSDDPAAVKTKSMERRRVRIRCGWWSRCVFHG